MGGVTKIAPKVQRFAEKISIIKRRYRINIKNLKDTIISGE